MWPLTLLSDIAQFFYSFLISSSFLWFWIVVFVILLSSVVYIPGVILPLPILKWLDRVLLNTSWNSYLSSIIIEHLHRTVLHQSPLLISAKFHGGPMGSSFRFQNICLSYHSFLEVVRTAWSRSRDRTSLVVLVAKLRSRKSSLRTWNLSIFGNPKHNFTQAENVSSVEVCLILTPLLIIMNISIVLKQITLLILRMRRLCGGRNHIFIDGETNTACFHSHCQNMHNQLHISKTKSSIVPF